MVQKELKFSRPMPLMEKEKEKTRRSNYTGFSEYISTKEEKLRIQFDSNKTCKSEIFRGVCIHVNGLTKPPLSVLRSLILENGGAFEQYYHRDRVTHFICTHVAKAKLENFIKRSNGKIKVMKPEWITESIKAGKLLEEFNYRNYLNNDEKHNNLHYFFESEQKTKADEDEGVDIDLCGSEEYYDPEALDYDQLQESDTSEQNGINFDDDDEIELLADLIDASELENDGNDDSLYIELSSDSDSKSIVEVSHSPAKTSAHPEFLNDYYRSSRLHHISTWREELKTFAASLMLKKQVNYQNNKANVEKVIMHVDLDCFFVAVSLLKHPERELLKGQPIAVSHAKNDNWNVTDSSADISSCNYEARAFGVRSEMYIKQALKICPNLKIIPYDFEGYNFASQLFYEILAEWADELQAVSCDEAFLDLSSCELEPEKAAQQIRDEIRSKCRINASIGIGPNLLIARLATKNAKPNGQFRVKAGEVDTFIADQLIENLPGVGDALIDKLPANLMKCSQVQEIPLSDLQNRLGYRQGLNLYRKVRGEDDRTVGAQSERKSVGSEVSWGVRFASSGQCRRFLGELGGEVWQRMTEAFPSIPEPKPKRLQIKLYRRQEGAGASKKHLGRGICDTFHRSKTFPKGLTKQSVFIAELWQLFESEFLKALSTQIEDIRGIGVFLNEFACNSGIKQTHKDISELFSFTNKKKEKAHTNDNLWISESQVDLEVWPELPEEIRKELEEEWKNKKRKRPTSEDNGVSNRFSSSSINKHKKSASKPSVTLTQMWGHREEREQAQLLQDISALPADQFDHQVVTSLPRELQKEIVDQWKTEEERKRLQSEFHPFESFKVEWKAKHPQIDAAKILKVKECLPIEFRGCNDWTCESIYAFILKNKTTVDPLIIREIDNLLVELILKECLKPVGDACGLLKDNSEFNGVLEKMMRLISDLYEGSMLSY